MRNIVGEGVLVAASAEVSVVVFEVVVLHRGIFSAHPSTSLVLISRVYHAGSCWRHACCPRCPSSRHPSPANASVDFDRPVSEHVADDVRTAVEALPGAGHVGVEVHVSSL